MVVVGPPVFTLMPPVPRVSVPKVPWFTVSAPVLVLLTMMPAAEKFWSSVVVTGVAPAKPVLLKFTVLVEFGVKSASASSAALFQFVSAVPAPPFQLPFTSPRQKRLPAAPAVTPRTAEVALVVKV